MSSISGSELDWNVQAVAGHSHRILLQGTWTWEAQPGCGAFAAGGDRTRSLQINGASQFLVGETGTRTISWPTSYCADDGGRFKIDVLLKRDVPSVGDADRESVQLLVDCRFTKQP
jgi:hypothetical protein